MAGDCFIGEHVLGQAKWWMVLLVHTC